MNLYVFIYNIFIYIYTHKYIVFIIYILKLLTLGFLGVTKLSSFTISVNVSSMLCVTVL